MDVKGAYSESRILVLSYFREGGKVVGTEECSTEIEAFNFAKHQIRYYPYVEVALVSGMVNPWGYDIRHKEILAVFK